MKKNFALLIVLLLAGCVSRFDPDEVAKRDSMTAANPVVQEGFVPEMDPSRRVNEQDCSRPVDLTAGNLVCEKR